MFRLSAGHLQEVHQVYIKADAIVLVLLYVNSKNIITFSFVSSMLSIESYNFLKTPRTQLKKLNIITFLKFTHANKNNPTAFVSYVDLMCSLKMTVTG